MRIIYNVLISNPSLLGSIHCQATLELDRILDVSVGEQKQMLKEDKIIVLFYCSVYFLQNLNFYTCIYNQFFSCPYTRRRKRISFVMMTYGEESIFLNTSIQSIKLNFLHNLNTVVPKCITTFVDLQFCLTNVYNNT